MLPDDEIVQAALAQLTWYPCSIFSDSRRLFTYCGKDESDLDIMIDSDNMLGGFDYFGIVGTLVKKFPIAIDILEASEIDKNSVFYRNIQRDGVIVYES